MSEAHKIAAVDWYELVVEHRENPNFDVQRLIDAGDQLAALASAAARPPDPPAQIYAPDVERDLNENYTHEPAGAVADSPASLKRYSLSQFDVEGMPRTYEDPQGKWVLYAKVEERLRTARQQTERYRGQVEQWQTTVRELEAENIAWRGRVSAAEKAAFIQGFQAARRDSCGDEADEELIEHFWRALAAGPSIRASADSPIKVTRRSPALSEMEHSELIPSVPNGEGSGARCSARTDVFGRCALIWGHAGRHQNAIGEQFGAAGPSAPPKEQER